MGNLVLVEVLYLKKKLIYITSMRNNSTYIYLKENIEWASKMNLNKPEIIYRKCQILYLLNFQELIRME